MTGTFTFTDSANKTGSTRREFLGQLTMAGAGFTLAPLVTKGIPAEIRGLTNSPGGQNMTVSINVNGKKRTLSIEPRVTLLDALRENLKLTGTKKGCDRGQCGACTVLVNGRRVNSCLTLAAMCNNKEVTTIEGLAKGDKLHPMQEAFIKHDAFQCGYCTPGQICSAVGLVSEGHAKTDGDIQEQMSGNICRCGAYRNIVRAIKEVGNI
jgi:xanthine dehydrogenase YagT iron-sulfur-binding subunit